MTVTNAQGAVFADDPRFPNVFEDFKERTDPPNPPANTARLYAKDNGAGKTQVGVIMPTGVFIPLATEA